MATKRLAVILIDKFAEWEFGYLTSVARDYFGAEVRYYTPKGAEMTSEGGLIVKPHGRIEDLSPADFDALAVVGSSAWSGEDPPDIADLVTSADHSAKILGFICQGTLAAARAGLLDARPHTSNNAKTPKLVATYQGAGSYVDSPRAVRDVNLITASGSAAVTFGCEMLRAIWPERENDIASYEADLAKEHIKPS